MNTAIIAAAGIGQRFNADVPKQFIEIGGKPILFHSIGRFVNCDCIDTIIVVVAEEYFERLENDPLFSSQTKIQLITGGRTRAESVFNGFKAVDPETDVVAVHDGARPFVTPEEIRRTVERAGEVGAACLTAPVVDTVKEVEDGWILSTIDRRALRRAMTPQAFRYEILAEAFRASELGEEVTDECFLVEQIGMKIASVAGGTRNIKITHSEDLLLAETYLAEGY